MKKWYVVISVFFLVPILVLFSVSLFDKDEEKSETENRTLAQFPQFSLSRLFSGEFTEDFQTYFSDQFPNRDNYLGISKYINSLFSLQLGDETVIDVDVDDTWSHGGGISEEDDNDVLQTTATTQPAATSDTGTPATTAATTASAAPTTDATTADTTVPGLITRATTTADTTQATEPAVTTAPETTWSTSWTELASPWGDEEDPTGDITATDSGILFIDDRAMERVYKVDSYLSDYAETVNLLYDALPEDTRLFAMLVPKSIEFNAPAKYRSGEASQLAAINYAYSQMKQGIICVDAYSTLYEHRDEDLYFRTDHHWTARGAYWAFTAFCDYANLTPYALSDYTYDVVPGFLGTMYTYTQQYAQSAALANNPDDVEIFRPVTVSTMEVFSDFTLSDGAEKNLIYSTEYAINSLPSSWKYYVFLGGDRPICHITNPTVTNGRKALILKESYGNSFTPFLGDMFEEVWAIDPREFNGEDEPVYSDLAGFIAEQGITDVIVLNNVQSALPSYMDNIRALLGAED